METKVLRNLSDLNKVWFAPRSTWKVAITQEQYNDNIDRQGYYKKRVSRRIGRAYIINVQLMRIYDDLI